MNRAERRRMKRQEDKEPVINIKASDIERIKTETADLAEYRVLLKLLSLPLMVLHDKYGWGKTRCERLTAQVLDLHDSWTKGLLTIEDMEAVLWEEAGIRITNKRETEGRE